MSFASHAAAILRGPLGEDAIFTRAGGDPVAVRVMRKRPDSDLSFGDARLRMPTAVFIMATQDVPLKPSDGDTITCGETSYKVQGTPAADERQLQWTIEARPI